MTECLMQRTIDSAREYVLSRRESDEFDIPTVYETGGTDDAYDGTPDHVYLTLAMVRVILTYPSFSDDLGAGETLEIIAELTKDFTS